VAGRAAAVLAAATVAGVRVAVATVGETVVAVMVAARAAVELVGAMGEAEMAVEAMVQGLEQIAPLCCWRQRLSKGTANRWSANR